MRKEQPTFNVTADDAILWRDEGLHLLDQRSLPDKVEYIICETAADTAHAIRDMVVRGAPAIGITAAYGMALAARQSTAKASLEEAMRTLAASRPTAINLFWAIDRCRALLKRCNPGDLETELLKLARQIHQADIDDNRRMGDLGAALIAEGAGVLTHCNAGALATGGYGTALGVIRSAWQQQRLTQIFADETRPWLQGTRLTAWELARDGIPVKVLVEGAAASLIRSGAVNWIIVGADRVVANGDVANKIGTFGLAVLARYHGVKFMVVAPTSTIDRGTLSGADIPIEQRDGDELFSSNDPLIQAWNPVFDVTPAELVDVLVTERGVIHSPNSEKVAELFSESH
ncbi:MAG: S-methyl-5-thioribose-1-phosphate isomerase [bacterium]